MPRGCSQQGDFRRLLRWKPGDEEKDVLMFFQDAYIGSGAFLKTGGSVNGGLGSTKKSR